MWKKYLSEIQVPVWMSLAEIWQPVKNQYYFLMHLHKDKSQKYLSQFLSIGQNWNKMQKMLMFYCIVHKNTKFKMIL